MIALEVRYSTEEEGTRILNPIPTCGLGDLEGTELKRLPAQELPALSHYTCKDQELGSDLG